MARKRMARKTARLLALRMCSVSQVSVSEHENDNRPPPPPPRQNCSPPSPVVSHTVANYDSSSKSSGNELILPVLGQQLQQELGKEAEDHDPDSSDDESYVDAQGEEYGPNLEEEDKELEADEAADPDELLEDEGPTQKKHKGQGGKSSSKVKHCQPRAPEKRTKSRRKPQRPCPADDEEEENTRYNNHDLESHRRKKERNRIDNREAEDKENNKKAALRQQEKLANSLERQKKRGDNYKVCVPRSCICLL